MSPLPRDRQSPGELWKRAEADARRRKLEELLAMHVRTWGLPEPKREYRFHDTRGWLFDFAWPEFMVSAEVEGLLHGGGGRHQRLAGFERDAEKYNEAGLSGWTVLRFTRGQIKSGYAIRAIQIALERAAAAPTGEK